MRVSFSNYEGNGNVLELLEVFLDVQNIHCSEKNNCESRAASASISELVSTSKNVSEFY